MSLAAITWALQVRKDKNVSDSALRTLECLANYAGDEHFHAWPRVETLASMRGVDERTIYRHLDALEKRGYILRGDPRFVDHMPLDRRPTVWAVQVPRPDTDVTPRGDTDVTPRGDTDVSHGVTSGVTAIEEELKMNNKLPSHVRKSRARAVAEATPGRDCIHGHEALVHIEQNPRSKWRGMQVPTCPMCRRSGVITLELEQTRSDVEAVSA